MIFITVCRSKAISRAMIDAIEKTINQHYYLPREGRDWFLSDDVKLRTPGRNSLGFSLDDERKPPFVFFGGSPPAHMAKMCDAIVALSFEQRIYLFIIEQKTSSPGDYKKQTANGKYFCEWLFSLYKEHGHCSADPVYIGLLVRKPRAVPRKGETSHSNPVRRTHHRFEHFFEEKNTRNIYLQKFIRSL